MVMNASTQISESALLIGGWKWNPLAPESCPKTKHGLHSLRVCAILLYLKGVRCE